MTATGGAERRTHAAAGGGALALGALGVVFGDIGTSPLYAFREAFHRGADSATRFFKLPTDRVFEVGTPVEI